MKSSDLNESIFWRTVRRIFMLIAEYGWNFLHSLLTCIMFPIFLNNFHWWIPSTKLKGWIKELITLMKYNKVSWTSHQHSTVTPSSTVLDFVASSLLFTQKIVTKQAYICKIFVIRKKTISPEANTQQRAPAFCNITWDIWCKKIHDFKFVQVSL